MNKSTFDQREVQDTINEMLAAQGEHTYWEGKTFETADTIDSGMFTAEQLAVIRAALDKADESLRSIPSNAKPF